jgi:hypothetical protein
MENPTPIPTLDARVDIDVDEAYREYLDPI